VWRALQPEPRGQRETADVTLIAPRSEAAIVSENGERETFEILCVRRSSTPYPT